MIGRLIWNHDRPDIAFDTGALYGGLHCGDCFQCWMDGQWLAWSTVRVHFDRELLREGVGSLSTEACL